MKIINFFREASPLKLVGIALILALPVTFIEESFPTIFIVFRLCSFALLMYVVVKLLFKD
jgi:hypothetical protein